MQVGSKDQLEKERCNNESIEKPIISRYLFSYPRLIFRFIFLINGFKKLLYRNENNGLSLLEEYATPITDCSIYINRNRDQKLGENSSFERLIVTTERVVFMGQRQFHRW